MLKKILSLINCSALVFMCSSQTILIQEMFHGGVSVAGFSTALGVGSGNVELFMESGSSPRKLLLFAYTYGESTSGEVRINNDSFIIDSANVLVTNAFLNPFYSPLNLHVVDITDWYLNNFTLNPILETIIHEEMPFRGVFAPTLYLQYENPLLPVIQSTIILNSLPNFGYFQNELFNLNPINVANNVAFSIYSDRLNSSPLKITSVSFNSNTLGNIFGGDNVNSEWNVGVKGHFYYQNNTLYALDDDIANNSMNGSDAIANVSEYILNQSTSVTFTLQQANYPNIQQQAINTILAYFLTYTSPCLPFETSLLTSDTTTCANASVQLGASGGIAYEWLPQTKLSCYDCPNPVFTGDSTINYTVRIWSTDSCSVVMPVRVRVVPQPNFESINLTENICGVESGSIAGTSTGLSLPHTYQINNGAPQNNFSFSNLEAGIYTITVTDANGCSQDSTVQIIEINNVQAAFSVNPSTGDAPLQVQTQNNSQNATQYQWFWEDQSSTLTNPSITLDTAGVYTLMLVAGNGATQCNDTASVMILVREPFEVFAYTFVTNEANVYQIYLSGVSEYKYDLYTLDGKLVYQKSGAVENAGSVDLWEISGVASSVYLFRIWVQAASGVEEEVEGKLVVVR